MIRAYMPGVVAIFVASDVAQTLRIRNYKCGVVAICIPPKRCGVFAQSEISEVAWRCHPKTTTSEAIRRSMQAYAIWLLRNEITQVDVATGNTNHSEVAECEGEVAKKARIDD